MVEFVDEAVTVEVERLAGGQVRPLAFVWRGCRYQIVAWGRESEAERASGIMRCVLVQTAGPVTWELCQDAASGEWRLGRRWSRGEGRLV